MSEYQMEIIHHDLDCKCHRRREWLEINGEMRAIYFSVKDPDTPPMSDEEKQKLARMIEKSLKEKK